MRASELTESGKTRSPSKLKGGVAETRRDSMDLVCWVRRWREVGSVIELRCLRGVVCGREGGRWWFEAGTSFRNHEHRFVSRSLKPGASGVFSSDGYRDA